MNVLEGSIRPVNGPLPAIQRLFKVTYDAKPEYSTRTVTLSHFIEASDIDVAYEIAQKWEKGRGWKLRKVEQELRVRRSTRLRSSLT